MIGPITPFTINKYYWGLERREIRDRVSISCSMDTRVRWNETMNYIFRHTPGWTGQFVEHVILYRYSEKMGDFQTGRFRITAMAQSHSIDRHGRHYTSGQHQSTACSSHRSLGRHKHTYFVYSATESRTTLIITPINGP